MKTLYIIRHAKSDWGSMSLRDFDRPLNSRGLRDAPLMAKLLLRKGVRPDKLVASPAERAKKTCHCFAEIFNLDPLNDIQYEKSIYEADEEDLDLIIRSFDNNAKCIFLFGHNPSLTHLAFKLSQGKVMDIPTCGIVAIESTADCWENIADFNSTLADFYFPKEVLGSFT